MIHILLSTVEAFVHKSLDTYAFVALTASSSTICDLIDMVTADNDRRQQQMDETGHDFRRNFRIIVMAIPSVPVIATLILYVIQFDSSSFTNPEYELVTLHPEHFLPYGSVLAIYHSVTAPTTYVPARDRRLRTSPEPDSARLPAFRHVTRSGTNRHLNVFLVVLNAEIKFRRYFHMVDQHPPTTPLPVDVLNLKRLTIKLVDILYWKPVPTEGSRGEAVYHKLMEQARKNPERTARPDSEKMKERGSSKDSDSAKERDMPGAWMD